MNALQVSNWSTVPKRLDKLKEARLVTAEEANVGSHKSKARFWKLEPKVGVKVAEAFEAAERSLAEASEPPGRPAITGAEPGEKLIMMIQHVVKKTTGGSG